MLNYLSQIPLIITPSLNNYAAVSDKQYHCIQLTHYSCINGKILSTNHNPFVDSAAVSEVDSLPHNYTEFSDWPPYQQYSRKPRLPYGFWHSRDSSSRILSVILCLYSHSYRFSVHDLKDVLPITGQEKIGRRQEVLSIHKSSPAMYRFSLLDWMVWLSGSQTTWNLFEMRTTESVI